MVCLFPTLILGISTIISKYWLRAFIRSLVSASFRYSLLPSFFLERLEDAGTDLESCRLDLPRGPRSGEVMKLGGMNSEVAVIGYCRVGGSDGVNEDRPTAMTYLSGIMRVVALPH